MGWRLAMQRSRGFAVAVHRGCGSVWWWHWRPPARLDGPSYRWMVRAWPASSADQTDQTTASLSSSAETHAACAAVGCSAAQAGAKTRRTEWVAWGLTTLETARAGCPLETGNRRSSGGEQGSRLAAYSVHKKIQSKIRDNLISLFLSKFIIALDYISFYFRLTFFYRLVFYFSCVRVATCNIPVKGWTTCNGRDPTRGNGCLRTVSLVLFSFSHEQERKLPNL